MTADTGGPLGDVLANLGTPQAEAVASLLAFIIAFLVVIFLGRIIVQPLFERILDRRGLDTHAKRPLQKIASFTVLFVAIAVAFGFAGLGNFLQALATIAAAATLAIGFALQDVIRNFVAGIFIFTDKPFRIGDWIEWGENSGVVEDISLRVTRVRTFDNELLTVPNGELMGGVIKNPVNGDRLRLRVLFGIGYDDDIDEATDIILEEAGRHDAILTDPAPSVRLVELADSSVGLQARVWIADPSRADFVKTRGEFVQAIKGRFDEAGINIPYPNRTIGGDLSVSLLDERAPPADGD